MSQVVRRVFWVLQMRGSPHHIRSAKGLPPSHGGQPAGATLGPRLPLALWHPLHWSCRVGALEGRLDDAPPRPLWNSLQGGEICSGNACPETAYGMLPKIVRSLNRHVLRHARSGTPSKGVKSAAAMCLSEEAAHGLLPKIDKSLNRHVANHSCAILHLYAHFYESVSIMVMPASSF